MTGGGNTVPVAFLVGVDGTLLDHDSVQRDLEDYLERKYGAASRDRYRTILDQLRQSLGYPDYLGALQRYRVEYRHDNRLRSMASFLLDYPFAKRLYPHALEVLRRFRTWGQTIVLSDGDVIFQPRKIERSGILDAVEGHVLIYIHKEDALDDIEDHYPARHYVLVDQSPRTLATFREAWGSRVTTVLSRQGKAARVAADLGRYATPDITVERIDELLDYELPSLLARGEIEVAG